MSSIAYALKTKPLRLVPDEPRKKPERLVTKSTDFVSYAEDKLAERIHRIYQLEQEIENLKDDNNSYLVAVAGLMITLGLVLFQWLVVCNGQAPAG